VFRELDMVTAACLMIPRGIASSSSPGLTNSIAQRVGGTLIYVSGARGAGWKVGI